MVVGGIFSLLLVACLAAVFRAEFEAWTPWLAERLRRLALRPLCGELRERLDEEWRAYLEEVPGFLGKVICAVGFNWASRQVAVELFARRFAQTALGQLMDLLFRASNKTSSVHGYLARRKWLRPLARLFGKLSARFFGAGLLTHGRRLDLIQDGTRRDAAIQRFHDDLDAFTLQLIAAKEAVERGGEMTGQFSLELESPEAE